MLCSEKNSASYGGTELHGVHGAAGFLRVTPCTPCFRVSRCHLVSVIYRGKISQQLHRDPVDHHAEIRRFRARGLPPVIEVARYLPQRLSALRAQQEMPPPAPA